MALIPLTLWLVFSFVGLVGADLNTVKSWVGSHGNPVLLGLTIVIMFHHAALGIQVIIEDYVHGEGIKTTSIIVAKAISILLSASCILAVLRLTFEG
tara:strand:- start:5659 stop:5949 length:291 start_codon:yes stop_codon:yes gene_type:complete